MVGSVMGTFSTWHATLWDKIQVDELVEDTRKMIRDLKTLNKAVRGYDVYRCMPLAYCTLPPQPHLDEIVRRGIALTGCWRRR